MYQVSVIMVWFIGVGWLICVLSLVAILVCDVFVIL